MLRRSFSLASAASAGTMNNAFSNDSPANYAWANYKITALASFIEHASDRLARLGAKVSKFGDRFIPLHYPREDMNRLPRVVPLEGHRALVADNVFIASSAVVVGDVKIGRKCYIGYNAIIKADPHEQIVIGESANVQEKAVLVGNTTLGKWVTVEPMAIVESADVASSSFVGANAIVMKGAKIESNAMLCASAVLQAGATIPSGEVWAGNPAVKIGTLTEDEKEYVVKAAKHMVLLALEHRDAQELTWEEVYDMYDARSKYADMAAYNQDARVKAFWVKEPPRLTNRSTRTSPWEGVEGRHRPSGGWESTQGY